MAVEISSITKYIGTAAERAALDTSGMLYGSEYFETDTGLVYKVDESGNWYAEGGATESTLNDMYTIADNENESLTGYKGVINSDHAYIHEGIGFLSTLDIGTLGDGATESYLFQTPETKYIHLKKIELHGIGSSVKLEIMRGTTANPLTINSEGSTASELIGPSNANDNASNTSGIVVKKTPTYTNDEEGEIWDFIKVLGTASNQYETVSEQSYGENFELVLKPDTDYVIKFTNLSSDAASEVTLRMFWYEEGEGVVE